MEQTKTETKKKKVNRFYQFTKWLKGNLFLYFIAVSLLISLQYFRTITPLFMQYILNTVLAGSQSELPMYLQTIIDPIGGYIRTSEIAGVLIRLALVYAGFSLFRVFIMFARRMVNAVFTERVAYNMRNTLYKKLQNLSFNYHSHAESGDLIQRCTTDVETYRTFVGEQLIEVFRLVFLIGFTIYQMMRMSPIVTLFSVMVTPIIFGAAFIYFIKVKKVFKKVYEKS